MLCALCASDGHSGDRPRAQRSFCTLLRIRAAGRRSERHSAASTCHGALCSSFALGHVRCGLQGLRFAHHSPGTFSTNKGEGGAFSRAEPSPRCSAEGQERASGKQLGGKQGAHPGPRATGWYTSYSPGPHFAERRAAALKERGAVSASSTTEKSRRDVGTEWRIAAQNGRSRCPHPPPSAGEKKEISGRYLQAPQITACENEPNQVYIYEL